jgi:protein-tyrosine-phosphatase
MAKGFFNALAENAWADSAGIKPAEEADPNAIKVMKEVNIDIGQNKPKMLTFAMNNEYDYIVTMGCINECPTTLKEKTIEWNIEDPKGKTIDKYRDIRDQIENHVKKLIERVEK